jgi:flagellar hook-associated protein 2
MSIPMPGLAVQNFDINRTIEQLVEVRREPLKRMENEISEFNLQKDIWESLRKRLVNLGDLSRRLYDYTSPFGFLLAESGDPSSFTASAERRAAQGERRIQVLQNAAAQRISSDSVRRERRLPESIFTIEVGDKKATVDFSFGGTLADLSRVIETAAREVVRTSFAHDTLNTSVLILEAISGGTGNEIRFGGDKTTLIEAGIIGEQEPETAIVPMGSPADWTGYRGVQLEQSDWRSRNGILDIAAGRRLEYALPKTLVAADGWTVRFSVRFDSSDPSAQPAGDSEQTQNGDADGQSGDILIGPTDPVRIENLSIHGNRLATGLDGGPDRNSPFSPTRGQQGAQANAQTMATNTSVFYLVQDDGRRNEFVVPVPFENGNWQEVSLPLADISGLRSSAYLVLANDNTVTQVRFRDIVFERDAEGGLGVKNELVAPRDAILTVDGVRITRPENSITDAIDGITLNLIRAGAETTLRVRHDNDTIARTILDFIEGYNQTIFYLNAVSTPLSREERERHEQELKNKSELVRALEDRDQAEEDRHRGKLPGDTTITQLKNSMSTIMMSPYTTRLGRDLTLLIQAGISTGKVGADWETLRRSSGTLEVDTALLRSIIERDVVALAQLFGRDSTGNHVIDQGAAFRIQELARTYTQPGNSGMIAVRTRSIDRLIADKRRSLESAERSVKAYEEQLRRQFGTMETRVRDYQSRGRWLNQNQNNNNR